MGNEERELALPLPKKLRLLEIYGSMDEVKRLYYSYGCIMERQNAYISDSVLSNMFYQTSVKRLQPRWAR